MKEMLGKHTSKLVLLLALAALRCPAGTPLSTATSPTDFSVDENFQRGWHEADVGVGALFSNLVRNANRPNIDYSLLYIQTAYTVTEPQGDAFYRGSFQLAPEISGAGIFHGAGSYVASATLWLRYDFVPQGWRVVPYIQGGFGASVLDIPEQYDGKSFNYNLEAAAGARYFIRPKCSLNLEYRFQHISNADMWMHNVGVNTSGPAMGISFFF
jgi:opacity protein-like surface antigen